MGRPERADRVFADMPATFQLAMIPLAVSLLFWSQRSSGYLDDIEHRAFKFFWEQSNTRTGFTKDRASDFGPDDHTACSCASIGFALAAYPIGVERHWIDRAAAYGRTKLTLQSLDTLYPNAHGWLYHFVDWSTGERLWGSEASSIDTSICLAGVLIARQYWKDKALDGLADTFVKRMDWDWMLTDGGKRSNEVFLNMGWTPERKFISARWSNFCELNMIYIQAYGINPTMTNAGWNRIGRDVAHDRGHTFLEGGPLFIHEMSNGFYDFSKKRDQLGFSYWVDTKESALANRAYCTDNPGHFKGYGSDFWGLSACDTPDGYSAEGTPPDLNDNGTITPTSAIAAIPYTPTESLSMLKYLRENYSEEYGEYGFPNGMNPSRNWHGPDVIGIDLGMMMLGIEDYRTGLPWKLSMSDPVVKLGFQRIGFKEDTAADSGPLVKGPGS
jgi:hypothetical protein